MTEDNTQLHTPPSKGHARGRVHAHVHRQLRRFPDLDIGGVDTRDLEPRDAWTLFKLLDGDQPYGTQPPSAGRAAN